VSAGQGSGTLPDLVVSQLFPWCSQEQLSRPVDGLNSLGLLEFDAIPGEPGQQVMAPGTDEAASGEPGVIGDLGDRRRRR
jgi:hypothetical protein